MADASGGMAVASPRLFMRATSTEFEALPGAMIRAAAPIPRSPEDGDTPQAFVLVSNVE